MTESESEDRSMIMGFAPPKGSCLFWAWMTPLVKTLKAWNLKPFYNMQQMMLMLSRGMKQGGGGAALIT